MKYKNLSCWIITEGLKGTENQCLGIAKALCVKPEIKRISLRQPWRLLSPYLGFECAASFTETLSPPWPDLLIASGRKSIASSRYVKKQSSGATFTVQVQDPRIRYDDFDLVVVPMHDPASGPNVIKTAAAPNLITQEKLDQARQQFPRFKDMKQPRAAVLIGGASRAYQMREDNMQSLCEQLKSVEAGLMITCSRRTGEKNKQILTAELAGKDGTWIWDGQGDNPYMGMLAWADYILVTADSVSMLSEACTTGKPVYMITLHGGSGRLTKLHENLKSRGALRPFAGILEKWDYEPLRDSDLVAKEIEDRMAARTG